MGRPGRKPEVVDGQEYWLCAHCDKYHPRNAFSTVKGKPHSYCRDCYRKIRSGEEEIEKIVGPEETPEEIPPETDRWIAKLAKLREFAAARNIPLATVLDLAVTRFLANPD